MTPSAAKYAAIMATILTVYFAAAAAVMDHGPAAPAAKAAASDVVGMIAGGLGLLAVLFWGTVLLRTLAAQPPTAGDDVDHWG
ncbi:hypothetical protein [Nocardioides sp.]|uniref:hypothetical protein n=1 Tax=Nocardioides sp. TaxID=35761 RepID=UPI0031FE5CB4|nr:hypothetical protein [Nocardioides sp.]